MLVLLGDLLYHGPRNNLPGEYDPKIVSALLNEHKEHIIAVRGNCEAEVDQMMLEFPCMADYTYLWLENTPVFVTHAIATTTAACRRWPLRARSCSTATPTSLPRNVSTHRYMNPGSTTLPKQGSPQSYMLIDGNNVYWKHLTDGTVYMQDVLNKEE